MRRALFVLLAAVLAIWGGAVWAADEEGFDYPPDIKKILDRKKLIVAMYHNDVMPMFFKDKNGKMIGHDVEQARAIAKELGVALEFNRSPKTFNEVAEVVSREEADMGISHLSATLGRGLIVRFSDPYLIVKPNLIINRLTAAKYKFPEDNPLKDIRHTDKKIGVKKGSSYVQFGKELFEKATIVQYPDWDKAIEAAYKGEVLAVLRDEIGVYNFMKVRHHLSVNLKMVSMDYPPDPIAIALPSKSTHLLDWVNVFLKQRQPRPTAKDIFWTYREDYKRLQEELQGR